VATKSKNRGVNKRGLGSWSRRGKLLIVRRPAIELFSVRSNVVGNQGGAQEGCQGKVDNQGRMKELDLLNVIGRSRGQRKTSQREGRPLAKGKWHS